MIFFSFFLSYFISWISLTNLFISFLNIASPSFNLFTWIVVFYLSPWILLAKRYLCSHEYHWPVFLSVSWTSLASLFILNIAVRSFNLLSWIPQGNTSLNWIFFEYSGLLAMITNVLCDVYLFVDLIHVILFRCIWII